MGELSTGVVGKDEVVEGETSRSAEGDNCSGATGEFRLRERKSNSTCYHSAKVF